MQKITFLGHDNASLSMLIESLFCLYGKDFFVEIITIMDAKSLLNKKSPYLIEGIKSTSNKHDEWFPEPDSFMILGSMVAKIKKNIFAFFNVNYALEHNSFETILHPTSVQSESCIIDAGSNMGPGAVIAPFTKIGRQVSINRNATIGHHTNISDFATLNPGCNVAGYCSIGEASTIGMGANIIDGIKIGNNVTIGAGSLVTKDIPDNVVAYGVPAKIIREKNK